MSTDTEFVDHPSADHAEAVRAVLSRATQTDGTAPISEQAVHSLGREGAARHLVAFGDDGEVAGYANVVPAQDGHPAMAEVVVDPPRRGHGLGRELVDRALTEGGDGTRVWAHGDLPAAQAVARRLGLTGVRELLQLRRSLEQDDLPALEVPDSVLLRTYGGPQDDAELLRVNAAAFEWHPEQGRWTAADVEERRRESWFDPEGLFLAFDPAEPEKLLGFHWTKVHPATASDPQLGEVVEHVQRQATAAIADLMLAGADPQGGHQDVEMLAQMLSGAVQALANWWYDHQEVPRAVLVDRVMAFAWLGLGRLSGAVPPS